jgi:hypothetical protein
MLRVTRLFVVLVLLFGSTMLSVVAQEATPGAAPAGDSLLGDLGYPEIRVSSDGTTHDFPAEIEAGRYHIVLENTSEFEVDLEFFQLPEGVALEELEAFFAEAQQGPEFTVPDFFFDMVFNGGPWAFPGETAGVVLDLTPGEWMVNHLVFDLETGEQTDSPTAFTVTGEMPELGEPEGIEIGLVDMDFVVPDTFEAGPQIWQVRNNGLQIHHLILLGVPDGTTEDDVMELAAMFAAGPPASPVAGATPVMPALNPEEVTDAFFTLLFSHDQFNLYEVDLEPGTYAMVCFMPDPSGTEHVMLGMVEIIVVE